MKRILSKMTEDDSIQLNIVNFSARKKSDDKKATNENIASFRTSIPASSSHTKSLSFNRKRPINDSSEEEKRFRRDNQSSNEIISSLFNKNPEIPRVTSSKNVQVTLEELFVSECFDELSIHPFLVSNLKSIYNISKMTCVQRKAIPYLLKGIDSLIKSQTGSGKTLAYVIPILHSLQAIEPKIQRADGTFALIIVPTRELAIQSFEWFEKLSKTFARIVPGCLMGGEKKKSEKARLRKGVNILVTTPGRLIDHLQTTTNLNLSKVLWLVLDEADRLLDLGYEKDISMIISKLREQAEVRPQTVMLSATMTAGIEKLAGLAMKKPKIIDAAATEEAETSFNHFVIPAALKQYYILVPLKLRFVTLMAFLLLKTKFSEESKILVFMPTQDMVDFHALMLKKFLNKSKMPYQESVDEVDSDSEDSVFIFKLHGNMTQQDRTQVFQHFKSASSGLLLCTDVACRGLDLPDVDWIVQYSATARTEDYVHRVGRTSRVGRSGHALLFLLPSEVGYVKLLEEKNISVHEMDLEEILQSLVAPSRSKKDDRRKKRKAPSVEEAATDLQLSLESAILSDDQLKALARQAFLSHVRAYATYPPALRHIFNFKQLHLGHLAKSLALRETPSQMGSRKTSNYRYKTKISNRKAGRPEKRTEHPLAIDLLSEFASGL